MATASRRRRRTSVPETAQRKQREGKAYGRLDEIAREQTKLIDKIDKLTADAAMLDAEAAQLMKGLDAEVYKVAGEGEHTYKEVIGNGRTDIDSRGFYDLVSDEDVFYETVQVPVGEAKKILGEKELKSISTYTPGQSKGRQYKFKRVTK